MGLLVALVVVGLVILDVSPHGTRNCRACARLNSEARRMNGKEV